MQRTVSAHRAATVIGTGPWPSPAYAALTTALRRAIGDGRLPAGSRLPGERDLAAAVGLSRTTTTRAYRQLRDQGYLTTRRGSGSVVRIPDVPGGRVDHLLAPTGLLDDGIDLTCTAPISPPGLTEAYAAALDQIRAYLPGTGYYPGGLPVLREQVAAGYTARGLPTDADQIVITSGALAGAAIAARALISPGDRVLVESPTYPNAIATLEGAGARLVPHPLDTGPDGYGWDLDALATLVKQSRPRAAYLIPDFHNPTGALLPADGRARLRRILKSARVVPIIDESLVEMRLDDVTVPPPLAIGLPDAVTVGSVSKTYWGGLRIGWMRLPRGRVEEMATSRLRLDLGAPVLEQLVVTELLRHGDKLVRIQRQRLRAARDTLVDQVRAHLPDWEFAVPHGGLALWCRLPGERSTALAKEAHRHGVVLAAGANFAPGGGLDGWIRLPYTVDEQQLAEVGPRLAKAWSQARSGDSGPSRQRCRIVA